MRIAVCDDEKAQRSLIIKYLQEWARENGQIVEISEFSDGESLLFCWEDDRRFDLLILDIEMGALSGMELAGRIRREDEEIPILFITGYETYMAQGYEVAAIQYLLKPLSKEKLFAVMGRLKRRQKPEEKLKFLTGEGMLLLTPSEIWFAEAQGHQSLLFTARGSYQLRHSMTELLKTLGGKEGFVRCHRCYLVNLRHISAITRTELVMDDFRRLPVSRSAYKAVNEAFIASYGYGAGIAGRTG